MFRLPKPLYEAIPVFYLVAAFSLQSLSNSTTVSVFSYFLIGFALYIMARRWVACGKAQKNEPKWDPWR